MKHRQELYTGICKGTIVALATSVLLSVCPSASAQILIGQTAGFTGPVADGVREASLGAKIYLDAVNARGGVHGQRVELIALDDKFQPKLAAENARILIEEKGVSALFLTRGTPQTEAILPFLEKNGIALIAPSTGAIVLREPVNKFVFNVRASYQHEAEKIVSHYTSIGTTRIAIVYADDSFGADSVAGARRGFDAAKLKPLLVEKYAREKPDFAPIAARLAASNAQMVIFFGSGSTVVDGTKSIRTAGFNGQFATLSNNASGGFAKIIGPGMIVSQVFPAERAIASPLVKELMLNLKARQDASPISPAMLEGFAGAKVLIEGLRRSGTNPTREKIRSALESIDHFDVGGMNVSFSPTDHSGLEYAELSVTSAGGKFLR